MNLKWQKHRHANGDRLFDVNIPLTITPAKSGPVFSEMFAKFFAEVAQSKELDHRTGLSCCVEITYGDVTVFSYRKDPRISEGTRVGVSLAFPAATSSRLFEETEGAPPFDKVMDKLQKDYVRAIRKSYVKQRPAEIKWELNVFDPDGDPL